ncbi:hypothetical protein EDB83DRAFT_2399619 [Lactarius deliciosus]|nr:hypothetical protein EDB83DRAFT_2399619 [Lactarius deliciosus]
MAPTACTHCASLQFLPPKQTREHLAFVGGLTIISSCFFLILLPSNQCATTSDPKKRRWFTLPCAFIRTLAANFLLATLATGPTPHLNFQSAQLQ